MLKVLKSGFYTTLQDIGRSGYRNMGVPVSGAMDEISLKKANALLENAREDAVLEITMTGPTLLFELPTYICLSGAKMSPTLNNKPIQNYTVIKVKAGDILSYGRLEEGFRSYLAVKGGFQGDKILGSHSFYYPLTSKPCYKDGDEILYGQIKHFEPVISELKLEKNVDNLKIEVLKGPEFSILTDTQLELLFTQDFTISKNNNRMAYQITEEIGTHEYGMITSGTLPGTVQLTPTGKLIILMKDGQTTGGYPRILQLTEAAIAILSQKRFGDILAFKLL